MPNQNLLLILCPNAVAHRRDKSILYPKSILILLCLINYSYLLNGNVKVFYNQFILFFIFMFFTLSFSIPIKLYYLANDYGAIINNYVFIALINRLISNVKGILWLLTLIEQLLFLQSNFLAGTCIKNLNIKYDVVKVKYNCKSTYINNIKCNISIFTLMSMNIAMLTLIIAFNMISPQEWLSKINILSINKKNDDDAKIIIFMW